jgi:hypothetical protein
MADEEIGRPTAAGTNVRSSLVALVLGIAIAVSVSKFFDVIGWGGELASQAAGAASGAAPLLVDFVSQRHRGAGRGVATQ